MTASCKYPICAKLSMVSAVDGVSFEVRDGEILGIIGPNGSGKNHVFNCVLANCCRARRNPCRWPATTGMRPCGTPRLGVSRTFNCCVSQLSVCCNLIPLPARHQGSMPRLLAVPMPGSVRLPNR